MGRLCELADKGRRQTSAFITFIDVRRYFYSFTPLNVLLGSVTLTIPIASLGLTNYSACEIYGKMLLTAGGHVTGTRM